ncbi:MAG: hypothetical protein AB7E70_09415 [Hyphomicrobiaceae bacterium]
MLCVGWGARVAIAIVAVVAGLSMLVPDTESAPRRKSRQQRAQPEAELPATRHQLALAPFTASLDPGDLDGVHPAGTSVFVDIALTTSQSGRRAPDRLRIELAGRGLDIVSVHGASTRLVREDGRIFADVRGIRRGRTSRLLVEARLKTDGQGMDATGKRALTVKLAKSAADEGVARTFEWKTADCSGDFHRSLVSIRDGKAAGMRPSLLTAKEGDRALPGRWLFWESNPRARLRSRAAARDGRPCEQWRGSGRRKRCVRWGEAPDPALKTADHGVPTKEEIALLAFLDGFVRSRGSIEDFGKRGRHAWITMRVSTDIRTFLTQGQHPALCTGAPEMLDYFEKRMGAFRTRGEAVASETAKAPALADLRIRLAYDVRKATPAPAVPSVAPAREPAKPADPSVPTSKAPEKPSSTMIITGSTPRPATTTPAAPAQPPAFSLAEPATPPRADAPLVQKIAYVAGLFSPSEKARAVADAASPFAALAEAKALLGGAWVKDVPKPIVQSSLAALRTLEAQAYAELFGREYKAVSVSFFGSIADIRAAHAKSCRCGS